MVLNRYFISLVLFITSVALPLSSVKAAKWYSSFDESVESLKIEEKLSSMSLKEKVGQLFIFGFAGKTASKKVTQTVSRLKPGGIIIFGRNIESADQMAFLNNHLQKTAMKSSKIPLLIALDQEGGEVSRIKFNPPLPSALSIGMTGDSSIAERMGYLIGQVISSLGFNMNLAPVLDLSDPNVASFIGTRSFGNDPKSVAAMASSYAMGLDLANVLSTGKHFPGHGGITADSHHGLPYKASTMPQLLSHDLLPYNIFAKALNSSAVMIAHIAFPNIDQTKTPATFSKVIVGNLLRKQLKYNGLVITDDIEMAAAGGIGNFDERAIRAIEAGSDMVMVASNRKAQSRAINAVLRAVRSGRISQQLIDEANRRILRTKAKVHSLDEFVPANMGQFKKVVKSQYIHQLTDSVLEKNFYLSLSNLKDESFIWSDRPVYIFSSSRSFFTQFKKNSKLSSIWVPYSSKNKQLFQQKMQRAERSYGVFYLTGRKSAKMANQLPLEVKRRTFLVNASVPGLIKDTDNYIGHINIFSNHPKVGKLMAENIIRPSSELIRPGTSLRGPASRSHPEYQ